MKKNNTMGYDQTKKMLNIIRSLSKNGNINKKRLSEQTEPNDPSVNTAQKDDVLVINDVDVKLLYTDNADMVLSDQHKTSISTIIDSFRDQVSELTNFEPGLTITEKQIRLDGSIQDIDINFVLISGDESGLYINADMLQIDDDVLQVLGKLQKFELPFKEQMNVIIRDRFNN